AMVVVTSVMGGFGNASEDRLVNYEPHLIIKSKAETLSEAKAELVGLSNTLEKHGRLHSLLFDQEQVVLRTPGGHYSGAIAKGLEEDSLQHFIEASRQYNQSKVQKFSWKADVASPMVIANDDVMVGADLAYQTGVFVGDQVVLT